MRREVPCPVKCPDGSRAWYLDGGLHREDGPAVEWADGTKEWWVDDKRHREGGPVVEGSEAPWPDSLYGRWVQRDLLRRAGMNQAGRS